MTLLEHASMLTFEPDDHTYWFGLERVPSVSEILRPLTDPFLARIPESTLNWKRDLGIAVHKACQLFDLGQLDEESLDPAIVPYLEGYKTFLVDYEPTWDGIEQIVFEPTARYAGTLDRVGRTKDGPTLIDIKTSAKIQPTAALQLWAYRMAYDPTATPDLAVVQLLPTANYTFKLFTNYGSYMATWDGLCAIYRWNRENPK